MVEGFSVVVVEVVVVVVEMGGGIAVVVVVGAGFDGASIPVVVNSVEDVVDVADVWLGSAKTYN